uniref:Uncharacterized protein n=1 Tax=Lotharella oceanica TaxID=641309 RepID=A0A7S2U3A1_9EUKA|mmetsp:Transcript_8079/g.15878  ORF Transcript_8079/g.15878 Transcript_8079/m.15878 type:complete len:108 (+) Transcript_8079:96-419(+)
MKHEHYRRWGPGGMALLCLVAIWTTLGGTVQNQPSQRLRAKTTIGAAEMTVIHIVLLKFASPNDSKVAASMKKACEIIRTIPGSSRQSSFGRGQRKNMSICRRCDQR